MQEQNNIKQATYNLGQVIGLLAKVDKRVANKAKSGVLFPLMTLAEAMKIAYRKLDKETDAQITNLLDAVPIDYPTHPNAINNDLQGIWWLGYYKGLSGDEKPHGIAAFRKIRGMTQAELAEKLEVARSHVAKWEAGENTPRAETLLKIAEILGTSVDDLI